MEISKLIKNLAKALSLLEKFGFQLIAYSYPCQWRIKPKSNTSQPRQA